MGDQIRGFGFTNDGSVDTMFRFFHALVFNPTLNSGFSAGSTPTPRGAMSSSTCWRSTAISLPSSASRSR